MCEQLCDCTVSVSMRVYIVTFTTDPSSVAAYSSSHCYKDSRGRKKKKLTSGASVFVKVLSFSKFVLPLCFLKDCDRWRLLSCSAVFPSVITSPWFLKANNAEVRDS